jgi:hypothetical protein
VRSVVEEQPGVGQEEILRRTAASYVGSS